MTERTITSCAAVREDITTVTTIRTIITIYRDTVRPQITTDFPRISRPAHTTDLRMIIRPEAAAGAVILPAAPTVPAAHTATAAIRAPRSPIHRDLTALEALTAPAASEAAAQEAAAPDSEGKNRNTDIYRAGARYLF